MILSIKFSTDFDKILIEDTVDTLRKLDPHRKGIGWGSHSFEECC
jgi:hypothetical protein